MCTGASGADQSDAQHCTGGHVDICGYHLDLQNVLTAAAGLPQAQASIVARVKVPQQLFIGACASQFHMDCGVKPAIHIVFEWLICFTTLAEVAWFAACTAFFMHVATKVVLQNKFSCT